MCCLAAKNEEQSSLNMGSIPIQPYMNIDPIPKVFLRATTRIETVRLGGKREGIAALFRVLDNDGGGLEAKSAD